MIRVVDVVQHYGVRPVLKQISLEIAAGQVVVFVGPNGMGKTTLLNVMAGVLSPQRGFVEFDGLRRRGSTADEIEIRRRVVFLPDHPWLPSNFTGREFLQAVGRLYDVEDARLMNHVERLLTVFELAKEGDWPIRSYSNGQQKKIAICSALVTDAPVLLLDEPFSGGLDPAGIMALKCIVRHLGLGLVVRLWMLPWAALAVALATYAIAYFGLRRTLMLFPWPKTGMISTRAPEKKVALSTDLWKLAMSKDIGGAMIPKQPNSLGWPWELMRPKQPRMAIAWRDGSAISLLLGWWVYAIAANPIKPELRVFVLGASLFTIPMVLAIARISRYCQNYRSPISGWGRLFTLHWIIPGYDKVLVAPLLASAVPFIAVFVLILGAGLDRLLVSPISIAVASMIALNMGPSLKNWRHTGNHRIVPRYDARTHLQI